MPKNLIRFFTLIFFLFFHPPVFAASSGDVLINEFSSNTDPEWVELYNNTDTNISLLNWNLKDAAQPTKDISILGEIAVHDFKVFEVGSGWLNNSGGDVLTLLANNGATIDTISYGHSGDSISTPTSGKSAGRNPDGSGNWQIFETPTKGLTNNTASPTPSPSPTPTASPKAKSPSPTPKSTQTLTKSSSPQPQGQTAKTQQATVLGQKLESTPTATPSASPSPTATPTPQPQSGTNKTKIAAALAGSGLFLIGLSIGAYLWYSSKTGKAKNED